MRYVPTSSCMDKQVAKLNARRPTTGNDGAKACKPSPTTSRTWHACTFQGTQPQPLTFGLGHDFLSILRNSGLLLQLGLEALDSPRGDQVDLHGLLAPLDDDGVRHAAENCVDLFVGATASGKRYAQASRRWPAKKWKCEDVRRKRLHSQYIRLSVAENTVILRTYVRTCKDRGQSSMTHKC